MMLIYIYRVHNRGRSRSIERQDRERSERERSPISYCASADDEWSRSSSSTGDCTIRGGETSTELTLYSKLANRGRDFRLGGPRPCCREPDPYRLGSIQENCERLYTTPGQIFSAFEQVQDLEVQNDLSVDRQIFGPPVKEDYENLLSTLLYCYNILNI